MKSLEKLTQEREELRKLLEDNEKEKEDNEDYIR